MYHGSLSLYFLMGLCLFNCEFHSSVFASVTNHQVHKPAVRRALFISVCHLHSVYAASMTTCIKTNTHICLGLCVWKSEQTRAMCMCVSLAGRPGHCALLDLSVLNYTKELNQATYKHTSIQGRTSLLDQLSSLLDQICAFNFYQIRSTHQIFQARSAHQKPIRLDLHIISLRLDLHIRTLLDQICTLDFYQIRSRLQNTIRSDLHITTLLYQI